MESIIKTRSTENIITIENIDLTQDATILNHQYDFPTSNQIPTHHYQEIAQDTSSGFRSPSEESYKYTTMYPPGQTGPNNPSLMSEDAAYQDPTELQSVSSAWLSLPDNLRQY